MGVKLVVVHWSQPPQNFDLPLSVCASYVLGAQLSPAVGQSTRPWGPSHQPKSTLSQSTGGGTLEGTAVPVPAVR